MQRVLKLGLSIMLAMPILSSAVVLAEGTTTGSTNVTPGTTSTTPPPPTRTEIKPQPPIATTEPQRPQTAEELRLQQARLEQRKAEIKLKLSNAEKLNIQNKCKAAQGLVSSVKGRAKGIETSRSEVYGNIVAHITELSTKLKNKNADTVALNADIAALQAKIATFNTDLATYKQAVIDLADMDCKTDPDGFKASLQAARTALEAVNKDSAAVRSYVKDTIKPELAKLRAALEAAKTGGN